MPSPTQRRLTFDDLTVATRNALGRGVETATPLSNGSFGSVWRLRLDDGRDVVLKSAPDPAARLLTYEAGMLPAEAAYLRLAGSVPGVPVADLLFVDDDALYMSCLPGVSMCDVPDGTDVTRVRFESGAAIARLHSVTGDRFGYTGDRPHATNWPDAFAAMIDAALLDGAAWRVPLAVPADLIRSLVADRRDLLAAATTPALLHFDLWDGNVMADVTGGEAHLTGLVDGERYLFGDPLVDLVSPALFATMTDDPDHPFLRGYRTVRPFPIDDAVRVRVRLYQLYLYLLMVVEFPSRGAEMAGRQWDVNCRYLYQTIDALRAA